MELEVGIDSEGIANGLRTAKSSSKEEILTLLKFVKSDVTPKKHGGIYFVTSFKPTIGIKYLDAAWSLKTRVFYSLSLYAL